MENPTDGKKDKSSSEEKPAEAGKNPADSSSEAGEKKKD